MIVIKQTNTITIPHVNKSSIDPPPLGGLVYKFHGCLLYCLFLVTLSRRLLCQCLISTHTERITKIAGISYQGDKLKI